MNQNTTSLAEIKRQYEGGAHVLLPVSSEVQINPFYKYEVMTVTADISENSGDIFKVGRIPQGKNIWIDVFSPAKPLLMKLAAAAGIQFDPNHTYGEYISKNCYKAKAYGAIRLPDGTGKTHTDEKVINLEDEEDNFRLEFMDKAIKGITDKKASTEAAKMFRGDWIDSVDKYDTPCKAFVIADVDRQKYIDRSVLVNMTLLRKTFAEKAMTGAILRVIRALIGMKGTYTLEELKKPFVVPRVTFSPDYTDPAVRQMMLEQGVSSMSNMFGSQRGVMAPAAPIIDMTESDFNPEEFTANEAFISDQQDTLPDFPYEPEPPEPPMPPQYAPPAPPQAYDVQPDEPSDATAKVCSVCGADLHESVYGFSMRKYNRPLCRAHQKEADA